MKKTLCMIVMGVAAVAAAETYVWTGAAGDGKWASRANWKVESTGAMASAAPGRYESGTSGRADDTAIFTDLSNAPVTIDTSTLYEISNVVVRGGSYVFGKMSSTADQTFAILSSGGVFRVEAAARGVTVAAPFGFERTRFTGAPGVNSPYSPRIENDSSEPLVFNEFFEKGINAATVEMPIVFGGTGDIRIAGCAPKHHLYYLDLCQTGGGKLIVDTDLGAWSKTGIRRIRNEYGRANEIVLTENGSLWLYPGMDTFGTVAGTLRVTGAGTVVATAAQKSAANGGAWQNGDQYVTGDLTIAARMVSDDPASYGGFTPGYLHGEGAGTTEFGSRCELTGDVQILPSAADALPTLRAEALSLGGEKGTLGFGRVFLGNSARLLYTGPGQTFDQTIVITNETPKHSNAKAVAISPIGILEHGGSGKLVVKSPIRTDGVGAGAVATLVLANETEFDADLATTLDDNAGGGKLGLTKRGTGLWRLAAPVASSGPITLEAGTLALGQSGAIPSSASLVLQGGTFLIDAVPGTRDVTFPPTTVKGSVELRILSGSVVRIPTLTYTSGSLNVVNEGGDIYCTALKGQKPAWLTLNGRAIDTIGTDGRLLLASPAHTTAIAARGASVPNSSSAVVGITTAGSGGNDTLAASSTTVKGLVQKQTVDATVAIEAGQTFTVSALTVADGSGSLTIGDVAGRGTVTPPSGGTLELKNLDSRGADLVVQAAISTSDSKGQIIASTPSPVTLAGGTVSGKRFCPQVRGGTMRLTGPVTFDVHPGNVYTNSATVPVSTLLVDGGATVVCTYPTSGSTDRLFGVGYAGADGAPASVSRMIVSNGLFRTSNTTKTSFGNWTSSGYDAYTPADPLQIGCNAFGSLEVCAGGIVTNLLAVGGRYNGTSYESQGGVYQRGGEVVALGAQGGATAQDTRYATSALGIGRNRTAGFYELNDGAFKAFGDFIVGSVGQGSFYQHGGTAYFGKNLNSTNQCWLSIGNYTASRGQFWVDNGSVNCESTLTFLHAADGYGHLALEGGNTSFDNHANRISAVNAQGATTRAIANLDVREGAWLRAGGFVMHQGEAVNAPSEVHQFNLNFNGGTLKLGGDGRDVFCDRLPAYATKARDVCSVSRVTVYENGMTIDTDGHTGNTASVPLAGPVRGGVVSVDFPSPLTGYYAAPFAIVEGDGFGATAVAEFDSVNHKVKGVRITCPGTAYTSARVLLTIGASLTKATLTCRVSTEANPNTGSFTKAGAGDLTLLEPSTYGGSTVLAGGLLVAGTAGAVPEDSPVVLQGGSFDAGGFPTPYQYVYTSGAATSSLMSNGGPYTFRKGATLTILGDIMSVAHLDVMKFPHGYTGSLPTVVAADPQLILGVFGDTVKAYRADGMKFFIR